MTNNQYPAGNKVRITGTFTDASGALIDPGTVALKWMVAGVAQTAQAYNPGNIVRDSLGVYHYDVDTTNLVGQVVYEWVTTGTGQASVVGSFVVTALPL